MSDENTPSKPTQRVIHADCLEAMQAMDADSIDAIVCDPPYGLEFMGKDWDAPWKSAGWQSGGGFSKPGIGERRTEWPSFSATSKYGAANPTCGACGGRARGKKRCSCSEPQWKPIGKRRNPENDGLPDDVTGSGMSSHLRVYGEWCEEWAIEALRVAKPGTYLVAFGGTRTYHRLACAIEDAGWEIRDCLSWLYGSGFPKSLDVSKAIDKAAGVEREVLSTETRYNEPSGIVGAGRGASSRTLVERKITAPATDAAKQWEGWGTALKPAWEPAILARKPLTGTVASNVLAHGTGALNIDGCRIAASGPSPSIQRRGGKLPPAPGGIWPTAGDRKVWAEPHHGEDIGRWPANVLLDEEAAHLLDSQTGTLTAGVAVRRNVRGRSTGGFIGRHPDASDSGYGDSGGASRFFYTAKASRRERGEGNLHPTVKPIALMRWLCRLVCPPDGTILDPFCGSGTTLLAAKAEGFDAVGIEREAEYVKIIRRRLEEATPEWLREIELEGQEDGDGNTTKSEPSSTSLDDLFGFNDE